MCMKNRFQLAEIMFDQFKIGGISPGIKMTTNSSLLCMYLVIVNNSNGILLTLLLILINNI